MAYLFPANTSYLTFLVFVCNYDRANKEFAFLYEDNNDGKQSAMRDLDLLVTRRNTQIKRSTYKKRGFCGSNSPFCVFLASPAFYMPLLLAAFVVAFFFFVVRTTPYCGPDNAENQTCSYRRIFWPWECRPCPLNALCEQGQMECKEGFENVRGDICLQNGPSSNEYVPKLVSLLFDIDDGINW